MSYSNIKLYQMWKSYTLANVVGTKGQVVINKEIRQRLGIEPGWLALQRIVDDHVEVYFLPPEHTRSLAGCLREHIKPGVDVGLSWQEIRELAWSEAAKDRGLEVRELDLEDPADAVS